MVARIGLVGKLARTPSPRWRPRARSSLPLCSCALPHVLVSPQGNGSRQKASTSLQLLLDIDFPVHGMHPTTARPRPHCYAHINSLLHALTAHQPVCASQGPMAQTPMAAQMDLKLLAEASHPSTPCYILPRVDREAAPAVPQRLVAALGTRTVNPNTYSLICRLGVNVWCEKDAPTSNLAPTRRI